MSEFKPATWSVLGLGAAAGIGVVLLRGTKSSASAKNAQLLRLQERMASTHGYYALGLAGTAAAAYASYKSGAALSLASMHPLAYLASAFGLTLATYAGTRLVSQQERPW